MRVRPATAEDVEFVALHMRERDMQELAALSECDDRGALAAQMKARYGGVEGVMCGYDETPIWVAMTMQQRPGVMTVGLVATDDFVSVSLASTRFFRSLFASYEAEGTHRIEAVSMATYEAAHRWMGLLGLKYEAGPFWGYGKGGEAFIQLARLRDAGPVGV